MNRLSRIVRSAKPSTDIQFRKNTYGRDGIESYLRDVISMANASVEGRRYIVTGVEVDGSGKKRVHGVDRDDFSGKPAYQALANEYIEPPLRIRYHPLTVGGERVGIFEIGDCQDRPYMMRTDFSETLRRGDAYARVNQSPVKLGRRQLQALFEKKFHDSVYSAAIEVGFPGEIIHKRRKLVTHDLSALPSAVASAKLHELIDANNMGQAALANTTVARLTHARLFGSDSPYEECSTEDIMAEMQQIERRYADEDNVFLFEERAENLQLVILNQGEETICDASIMLIMPNHSALFVATRLPKHRKDDQFIALSPAEQEGYPTVALSDDAIRVSANLSDIEPGEPVEAFDVPLRLCAGSELNGRRIGIQYLLQAQNLRSPAKGTLKLTF